MAWEQSAFVAPSVTPIPVSVTAVPANRTMVMMFGWSDNTADTATITDNGGAGNVYTQLAMININSEWWGAAYCTNVQGSPTIITMTPGLAHGTAAFLIDVYAGPWTFFQSSSGTTAGAGVVTPTAILPPASGCLIYGTCISTTGASCAPHTGNGFTQRVTWTNVGCGQELIQGSPSSVSATFDVGSPGVAFQMVFSPPGGATGTLMGAICM
jgi:hypothetical protein